MMLSEALAFSNCLELHLWHLFYCVRSYIKSGVLPLYNITSLA